jgi:predicted DNA-binding WGR domain protein
LFYLLEYAGPRFALTLESRPALYGFQRHWGLACRSPSNSLSLYPLSLRRVESTGNMARFYNVDVERDLFGNVVLVRCWGRIGTRGKVRLDEFRDEVTARSAMSRLLLRKVRRGYRTTACSALNLLRKQAFCSF